MRKITLGYLFCSALLLTGCVNSGPTLDDIATGPEIDPNLQGVSNELTENERQRLIDILPDNLQPLHDSLTLLYLDDFVTFTVVEESAGPISIFWNNRGARFAIGYETGLYLRVRNRPFDMHDCPSPGVALADGAAILDTADSFSHTLRRYHEGSSGELLWDLTMPAVTTYDRYYFHGCVINSLREFTGEHTNIVEVEVVGALPDLYVQSAGITPEREVWAFVISRTYRPDIRGDSFAYEIESSRSGSSAITENVSDTSTLNFGVGAFFTTGTALRIPDDGSDYQVTIRINTDRGIVESNYDNNERTITVRATVMPAVLVLDRIHVRENCDARSPGDWQMRLLVRIDDLGKEWRIISNYFDVDDNTDYPTSARAGLFVFGLEHVPQTSWVTVGIGFEDCDVLTAGCGEEWYEHPLGIAFSSEGPYQDTGLATARLSDSGRATGETHSVYPPDRGGPCGDRAFTADVRLMEPGQAEAEGYIVDCMLTDRNLFDRPDGSPSVCE